MNLPPPAAQVAGCVWLPRIIAKGRLLFSGKLPDDYAQRFCCGDGVDHQFLTFFNLTKETILKICPLSDSEASTWFLALPSTEGKQIEKWNHQAVNMGRPGFPMAERLPVALGTTYKHLQGQNLQTVFEVLEADDKISAET